MFGSSFEGFDGKSEGKRGKARELNGSADIGPSLHLAVGIVEPSTATATVERYRQDADSARGRQIGRTLSRTFARSTINT
ncbi:hypothetical protein V1477_011992 [Vespula maculifrons]|uniref:Uncharacterized protein n=1 Tax=Vespula maculifrons TaxID=7453 RepID=A0ABD2C2J1_VESMC